MNGQSSFRDLQVWQLSMELVEAVYMWSDGLPRTEFDLRRQIRRAAISISSNIAEGARRKARRAYRNHVGIALGSTAELETEIELTIRLELISKEAAAPSIEKLVRVGQMLTRLHQSLSRKKNGSTGSGER